MENIGSKIKQLRNVNKMTQENLGELLLHKKSTVSKWENGKLIPDIGVIQQIAKIFKISIEELLDNTTLEKTVKRKKVNEEICFKWTKTNYEGISDMKLDKPTNWLKICLYSLFLLLFIIGAVVFLMFLLKVANKKSGQGLILYLLFGIILVVVGIIGSGITFKVYYHKEDKKVQHLKYNVEFLIRETFVEIKSLKSKKSKYIQTNDVKKIFASAQNNSTYQMNINIILSNGKQVTLYNVDDSVLNKLEKVL